MKAAIILLIEICLFLQMLLFEDMDGRQRCMWTVLLFCLPVVGAILYLVLGSSWPARFGKSRKAEPPVLKTTFCNKAALVSGWEEIVPGMLQDIASAQQTVDLAIYGFADDENGREWLSALCQAAQRGVRVRVLYDAFGSKKTGRRFFKPLTALGGQAQKVRPWPTHYRYHRKMMIVDGRILWMGSMNIGVKYIDRHPVKKPWRDTQVRIEGDAALEAEKLFLYDWRCAAEDDRAEEKKPAIPFPKGVEVSLLYSGAAGHRDEMHHAWIDMINGAKETLALQSPYLVPDAALLAAIESAARRGVDVTIMLPKIPSGPHIQPLTDEIAAAVCTSGVRILLYPGYLHSKTLCRDQMLTCIGSPNLDTRSMMIDEENCALIADAAFTASFMERFRRDEAICTTYAPDPLAKKNLGARLLHLIYALE